MLAYEFLFRIQLVLGNRICFPGKPLKTLLLLRFVLFERDRILCALRDKGREMFVRELEQGLKGFGPISRDYILYIYIYIYI